MVKNYTFSTKKFKMNYGYIIYFKGKEDAERIFVKYRNIVRSRISVNQDTFSIDDVEVNGSKIFFTTNAKETLERILSKGNACKYHIRKNK